MQKILILLAAALTLSACGNRNRTTADRNKEMKAKQETVAAENRVKTHSQTQATRTQAQAQTQVKTASPIDSLRQRPELGKVVSAEYRGTLPAADGPGIEYHLTIWHQEKSGDGVYTLHQKYLEAQQGKDMTVTTSGRFTTQRGDASDANAKVLRLSEFGGKGQALYFVADDRDMNSLTLLGADMKRPDSKNNYTLKRIAK